MPPAEDVHGTARGPQEAVADSSAVSGPDGPAPDKTAGSGPAADKSGPRTARPRAAARRAAGLAAAGFGAAKGTAARLRPGRTKSGQPRPRRPPPRWAAAVGRTARRAAGWLGRPGVGGAGFARLTVLPAIGVLAWLLPGLPLLLAGAFLPVPMLLISAPLAVALAVLGLRRVPVSWPRALSGERRERRLDAWYGLAGTVLVAAGFAIWQLIFRSEPVIVLRGAGAYLQTGYWIAQHGSLPIPQSLASFGGPHPGLTFSSAGFFAQGSSVVPASMAGLPMLLAGAFWVHSISAATALGPVIGGLAILAFGGLTGRLAGPRWAPAGALVLGFTLPEQYVSRSALAETTAQVLLFGGLCLVIDAVTIARANGAGPQAQAQAPAATAARRWASSRWQLSRRRWPLGQAHWFTPQRAMIALGGLALGMTSVVQVGGLLDVVPAIAFVGLLVVGRRAMGGAFSIGLIVGVAYGLADGYLLARPFMAALKPLPEVIGLIALWVAALTLAAVELLRYPRLRGDLRRVLAKRPLRWLPQACALLAVAALIGLAIRPYLQTVRGPATGPAADYVALLQRIAHLRPDPGRTYAEDTLYWVLWYIGFPAILLGGFGLALLVRRCVRALISWTDPSGAARAWGLPLAIICAGSAAVLWYPAVAPDQPAASRRLVPLVLPGLILFAIWASAWLVGRARDRGAGAVATSFVGVCCVAALLVPTAVTTFGLGLTHSGKGGSLQATADGLATKRIGAGQISAVRGLCASIRPDSSVVILDRRVAERFLQVIRGMCGVPAASMAGQPAAAVATVVSGIGAVGRRPVLLAARPGQLAGYSSPVRVLDLLTTQDPHTLTQPPARPWPVRYVIWLAVPNGFGAGGA